MRNRIDFESTDVTLWDYRKGLVYFWTLEGEEAGECKLSELADYVEKHGMDYTEEVVGNSSYDGNPAFDIEWCGKIGGMEFLQQSDENFIQAAKAYYNDHLASNERKEAA